jgi:hypothetical protein
MDMFSRQNAGDDLDAQGDDNVPDGGVKVYQSD